MPMKASAALLLLVVAVGAAVGGEAYKVKVTSKVGDDKVTRYTATDGLGSTVSWYFNLKNKNSRGMDTYEGPSGKVSDDAMRAIGFSASEITAAKFTTLGESGLRCGILNTWDNERLSWGLPQLAGRPGTLNNFLVWMKENHRRDFENVFADSGVDVQKNGDVVLHGKVLSFSTIKDGKARRAKMWEAVRDDDVALGTFLLAGARDRTCVSQMEFWRDTFLRPASSVRIRSRRLRDVFSSELLVVAATYLYNWMPAYTDEWFTEFFAKTPSVKFPASGSLSEADMEKAFDFINKKRVAAGRDKYPRSKSGAKPRTAVGSFKAGRSPARAARLAHNPESLHAARAKSAPRQVRYEWWLADPFLSSNEGGTLPGDEACNIAQGWCENTLRDRAGKTVNAARQPACSKAFKVPGEEAKNDPDGLFVPAETHKAGPARKHPDNNLCGGNAKRICCVVELTPKRELTERQISGAAYKEVDLNKHVLAPVLQDNTRVQQYEHRAQAVLGRLPKSVVSKAHKASSTSSADPLAAGAVRDPQTVINAGAK